MVSILNHDLRVVARPVLMGYGKCHLYDHSYVCIVLYSVFLTGSYSFLLVLGWGGEDAHSQLWKDRVHATQEAL